VELEWVNANGRSGGLVSLWDPGIFKKQDCLKHQNFMLISGCMIGMDEVFHIVNVYAPQDVGRKQSLWTTLLEVMNSRDGIWIFLGDFNAVRVPEERRNSEFNQVCARNFNNFILHANLMEYPMGGRRFTCVSSAGLKLSKIDRVLVCQRFWNLWPNASVTALHRGKSDHIPICLCTATINCGPKPFRFFNSWSTIPGFDEVVTGALMNHVSRGPPDRVLASKLRAIKNSIRSFLAAHKAESGAAAKELASEIEKLDEVMELRELN
jgi:hypothetical protein